MSGRAWRGFQACMPSAVVLCKTVQGVIGRMFALPRCPPAPVSRSCREGRC